MFPTTLRQALDITIAHYDRSAQAYWDGTRDHDVSQNTAALLDAMEGDPPLLHSRSGVRAWPRSAFLPGLGSRRDRPRRIRRRSSQWRAPIRGARSSIRTFSRWTCPQHHFDGVFTNASLFHVPSRELPRVVAQLRGALKSGGVLFSSNPRGNNEEGMSGDRYSCFLDLDTWRTHLRNAGFLELGHYYRPPELPPERQPWLATVWRRL